MSSAEQNLIWIDLEMTGLDTTTDEILEIAIIVTDAQLQEVAVAPVIAIQHAEQRLQAMDDWNTRTHSQSGLWSRVLDSEFDYAGAEQQMLAFLAPLVPARVSPMCGNSICQDRRFLARLMPRLESFFHYRNLDVSTVKELAVRWCPEVVEDFAKDSKHEALSDVRDSITELKYYRQFMGSFAGIEK